jgi:hypothetical protein
MAAILFFAPVTGHSYAVLAHQAIIDTAWESSIKPLLRQKYPQANEEQLSAAQAYAYGGSIIQDLGYYPHGSHFFSDLTHYVRSGDFVRALLRDACDVYEYAFALGALSHYVTDNDGHRLATNRAVPILYPKLRKKFGDTVAYEDDPLAHVKTEFGFDVLEVARENYAPESYHDFIGFEVSRELLDRAFEQTYGIKLKDVLADEELALNSYRRDVSKLIPRATRIAWSLKKEDIKAEAPSATERKFRYNVSRTEYEKEWGNKYLRPTRTDRFLAFLYKLLPKIGPLRVLELKVPTPETEQFFQASFNSAVDKYQVLLGEEGRGELKLYNINFDLGAVSRPGEYKLNDNARARLLHKLAEDKFRLASPEIRAELQSFFEKPDVPYAFKKDPKVWEQVQAELEQMRAAPPMDNQGSVTPRGAAAGAAAGEVKVKPQ